MWSGAFLPCRVAYRIVPYARRAVKRIRDLGGDANKELTTEDTELQMTR